jgi:hypothetical protein
MAISALVARVVDRGRLRTVQSGLRSLMVVAFPVVAGFSPFSRWSDALTGGIAALIVVVLLPNDVIGPLRQAVVRGWREIAAVLGTVAAGLERDSRRTAADFLVRGHVSQPVFDEWQASIRSAETLARVSPMPRLAAS